MLKTAENLLRYFSIRIRMLGAVAMVLGTFSLITAIAFIGGSRVHSLTGDFVGHSMRDAQAVSAVLQQLSALRVAEHRAVVERDDAGALAAHRQTWTRTLDAARQALGTAGREGTAGDPARAVLARLDAYAGKAEGAWAGVAAGADARAADALLAPARDELAAAEQAAAVAAKAVAEGAAQTQTAIESTLRMALTGFGLVFAMVLLVLIPLTLLNSHSITSPLRYAGAVAESISRGDLSQTLVFDGDDEATALLHALDHMQAQLRNVVGQVRESSRSIQCSSGEVASGNADLSARTEQAASSLQQTAASMEELTGTVRQSADAASQANQLAASAAVVAQRGGSVVSQVVSTMDEINASSRRIADIIGTIDGIAFQTNILALNAAVEAARAGQQGRGFAVVASEVRSLAQRSAEAAREIKALIGASVERVEAGSQLVADAGSTMGQIVASVQRVSDIIGEISAAAAEQSSGIGQVNGAVVHLDTVTQQNAALVEQSAAAAASLEAQATRLGQLVDGFRLQPA